MTKPSEWIGKRAGEIFTSHEKPFECDDAYARSYINAILEYLDNHSPCYQHDCRIDNPHTNE